MASSISSLSFILSTSSLPRSSFSSSLPSLHSICRLPKCPLSQSVRFTSKINNQRQCVIRLMSKDVDVERLEVPRSVAVRMAHELLLAGHRYLDVRKDEVKHYLFVDLNFPSDLGMMKNPNFLKEVSLVLDKDTEIIVGCQSGKRSLMAASDLQSAGFTGITDIAGGYSAWRENGLPTQ